VSPVFKERETERVRARAKNSNPLTSNSLYLLSYNPKQ
jgi:hypothetical protein